MCIRDRRPIAFAPRTLSVAERRYAQVDREALAVVFGTKKFHMYLFGRHFTIVTDHKPVLGLLNATRAIPAVCSPRVLRWSVDLGGYDYELIYRPGSSIPHVDALSRLPLPVQPVVVPGVSDILLLQSDCSLRLSSQTIADLSRNDPVISKVMHWAMHGWPAHVDSSFESFARRQAELTVESGCLVWGSRLVIPPKAASLCLIYFMTLTRVFRQPKPRLELMFGGQIWTSKLSRCANLANVVAYSRTDRSRHHLQHGLYQRSHGPGFIWTMRALFKVIPSCWLWMLIPIG